jgi:pimeloyl-ACP methyl ester carboxylesterase
MTKSLVALLFISLAFHSCSRQVPKASPAAAQEKDFTTPHYERRTNADNVIVFVHGVFGGGVGTWTNSETGAYWPKLLFDDHTFDNADVYVYSYSTPYFGQTYSIDELIDNMRLVLTNDEVFQKHKSVIFLCHSMGGLVVRGFLKRYPANANKVPLVYFFSTPTAGAHIAQLAKFLLDNPQLKGMLPAGSENYVSNLQRDWRAMTYHVNSRCAYEKLDTYGVRIVDEQSASALCDGPVDPVLSDHINIVKPKDKDAISYVAFRQAYIDGQATVAPVQETVTGIVQTARSVEVDCGQTREDTAVVAPPIEVKPQQRIVDAVVSLQDSSNLKEQHVSALGLVNQSARVHYRVVGPDLPSQGGCRHKGYVVILVTFLLTQPAGMKTAGFTPLAPDSIIVALSRTSGTLTITSPEKIVPVQDDAKTDVKSPILTMRSDVMVNVTGQNSNAAAQVSDVWADTHGMKTGSVNARRRESLPADRSQTPAPKKHTF